MARRIMSGQAWNWKTPDFINPVPLAGWPGHITWRNPMTTLEFYGKNKARNRTFSRADGYAVAAIAKKICKERGCSGYVHDWDNGYRCRVRSDGITEYIHS